MDLTPEKLYERLDRLLYLRKVISATNNGEKIAFGNRAVSEYNRLHGSLPESFSVDDLLEYHTYLEEIKDEHLAGLRELKETLLGRLKEMCTSGVYEIFENKIRQLFEDLD